MTKTLERFMTCVEIGGLMTIVNLIFGKIDYSFTFLMMVMVIDYLTGLACGWTDKTLSSNKATKGLFKKLFVLVYVIIGHHMDIMLHVNFVRTGICYMYAAGEVLSIIENGTKLGVPVPEPIKKALKIMNSDNVETK
jgi:toxin secretion/phage lysis holin